MADLVSFAIFFIGLYALIVKRQVLKSIIALVIMETAVILYFIAGGFREGMLPPLETFCLNGWLAPFPRRS